MKKRMSDSFKYIFCKCLEIRKFPNLIKLAYFNYKNFIEN